MKILKHYLSNPHIVLILGFLFLVLASPKWTFLLAPWLGYTCLLYYMRRVQTGRAIALTFAALVLSGIIGLYDVYPMPAPILVIIIFIMSLKAILPFLLDRWSRAKEKGLIGTLLFPTAFVTLEYLNTINSGDAWGSVANTQYAFQSIQQIASVFGIWGISFLVYWFASLLNWYFENGFKIKSVKRGLVVAVSIYMVVLIFGVFRISGTGSESWGDDRVKVAGVTIENKNVMETLYFEEFGKTLEIPADVSQTSPLLQEVNRAMVPFIEDPFASKYSKTRSVIGENLDKLFQRSTQAADQGAHIVVWSEAIGMLFNQEEEEVIRRGKALADAKNIYLVMGLAVVNPGPFTQDRLLIVNKTVTINPNGEVENIYLKSNPIPFAEQEYGSDDIIPVIDTPYGKLSPVICYDADFPHFMKQAGLKGTDILVVPSGDWKAIAPYHSYMASLRGIENGMTVVRPVSHGTSLVTDPYGNVLASDDFFGSDNKSFDAVVPTQGIDTLYNHIGDILAYLSMALTAIFTVELLVLFIKRKLQNMHGYKAKTVEA